MSEIGSTPISQMGFRKRSTVDRDLEIISAIEKARVIDLPIRHKKLLRLKKYDIELHEPHRRGYVRKYDIELKIKQLEKKCNSTVHYAQICILKELLER